MRFLFGLVLFLFSSLPAFAFSDTADYPWKESIGSLQLNGVIEGYSDNTFRPEEEINRAEFLKVLMEGLEISPALEKKCFKDLKGDEWFAGYVCRAKELGIVSGYSDGSFRANNQVSQPEALKMVFEGLEEELVDLGGEWFEKYFNHAEWLGMYYFDVRSPQDHLLTRGEASYFLNWLIYGSEDQVSAESFYDQRYESKIAYHTLDPQECFEGEVYDYEAQICYLDCGSEQECLDVEMDILFNFALFGELSEEVISEELVGTRYGVEGDELELIEGEDEEIYREAFEYFGDLIPKEEREMLSGFWIFSDGYGDSTAIVIQDEEDLSKWILMIDPADSHPGGVMDEEELTYTVVHEFAHLLSLNSEQVELVSEDVCEDAYFTGEGCSKEDSYINLFYQEFWLEEPSYVPADFVTEYAAVNAGEDFAESFTFFVLGDLAEGDSVASRKVNFFGRFPELVKLRNLIRAEI